MTQAAGRPSLFNEAVAEEICFRIADGDSLRKICGEDGFPERRTVFRWLADPAHEAFRRQYALAREASADADDDDIRHYSRQAADGLIEPANARAAIDGLKWSAGKRKPKVYGDASTVKHTGAIGSFDASKYSDEQLARLEDVLAAATAGAGDAEGDQGGEAEAGG